MLRHSAGPRIGGRTAGGGDKSGDVGGRCSVPGSARHNQPGRPVREPLATPAEPSARSDGAHPVQPGAAGTRPSPARPTTPRGPGSPGVGRSSSWGSTSRRGDPAGRRSRPGVRRASGGPVGPGVGDVLRRKFFPPPPPGRGAGRLRVPRPGHPEGEPEVLEPSPAGPGADRHRPPVADERRHLTWPGPDSRSRAGRRGAVAPDSLPPTCTAMVGNRPDSVPVAGKRADAIAARLPTCGCRFLATRTKKVKTTSGPRNDVLWRDRE